MEARGWKTETNDKVGGKDANRWPPGYTLQKYPFQSYRLGNFPGSGIRNKQVSDIESGYPDIESGYPDIRI